MAPALKIGACTLIHSPARYLNLLVAACLVLRHFVADAFIPASPIPTSQRAFDCPMNRRAFSSLSPLGMGASLLRIEGGEEGGDDVILEVGPEGTKLEGCVVEENGGRYYCTADEDGAASIGGNDLTAGVRYLLNEGMTIRTREGDEYEMKIEGGAAQGDPAMAMMFNAMKAGFATAEED